LGYVNPDHLDSVWGAPGLSSSEKSVLLAICRHWPNMRPSYDRLAEMTSIYPRTIKRVVKDLADRGILAVTARDGQPNVYSIDWESLKGGGCHGDTPHLARGGVMVTPGGCHGDTPGGVMVTPEVSNLRKQTSKPPNPPAGGGVVKSSDQVDQAAAILDGFYADWGRPGLGRHQRRHEIAKVASAVGAYGEAAVAKALGRLPAIIAKRFPACRTLGGGWDYLEEILAESAKAAKRAREAEQAAADRRAEEQRRQAAADEERARRADQVEQWRGLPEHQRQAILARVSSRFSRLSLSESMLLPYCLDEMERAPPAGRESLGGLFERVETKAG
jgi:hypothetical protein